jgi:DNA-binding NarL/FixJ family response regulator
MEQATLALYDDAVLLREGIASLLEKAGFEIVGQSGTAEDLLLKVRSYKPDIAIVDIKMPPTHTDEGLRAAKEIREKHPDTAVLVLSQYVEERYASELLSADTQAIGYLLKERVADAAGLVDALRRVIDGETVVDPTIVARLLGRKRRNDPLAELTSREREVLQMLAEGKTNKEIAVVLNLSVYTVDAHRGRIMEKLNVHSINELVRFAVRNGLID